MKMRSTRSSAPSDTFFNLIGYKPYDYQARIHESWSLYRTAIIGRQSGKSQVAAVEAAYEILVNIGSTGWVVAPTYKQAEYVFERVRTFVQSADTILPGKRKLRISNRDMRLIVDHYDENGTMLGTTRFQGMSADNEDNLRGASLNYIIIDEAAMIPERVWQAALAPTLTTTNGWVLIITTPKGFNWVHDFYQMGVSNNDNPMAMYASWQLPTWEANPVVPAEFFEEQKRVLAERVYRQEYGAEFISDSGSVFQSLHEVPKLPVIKRDGNSITTKNRNPMHSYAIGADFARLDDFSVFTVVDIESREVCKVVRMNTVKWELQLARLKSLHTEYPNSIIVADEQGIGDVLTEQLASMGLPYQGVGWRSNSIKEGFINKLAISIEHKNISLPDDPEYLDEFASFIYEKTPSGQLKMLASGKGKDDRVASLAMAWSLVPEHGGGILQLADDGYAIDLDMLDAVDELRDIRF